MHNFAGVPAVTPVRTHSVVRESAGSVPVSYGTKDDGWRSLGPNGMGRELPSAMQDRAISLSFKAYRTNPLAHRLIEMQINFVLGNGITVNSNNAQIVQAIHRWWTDPYNRWARRIVPRLRDLGIYGEWLHRPLITPEGFVRVADVQPDIICGLMPEKMDHGVLDQVVIKQVINGSQVLKEYPVPLIRQRFRDNTFELEDTLSGSLHYFGINRTTDTMRGVGDLFPLIDYLDIHDNILFSHAEKIVTSSQFFYDLTIDGMQQEEMDRFVADHTNLPPRPGSVWAHNPGMIMVPTAPKMNTTEHSEDTRLIKSHIVSAYGFPGTWFDEPGSAGRAVGGDMAEAPLRNIVMAQATVGEFLRDEIDHYLEQLAQAGNLDLPADRDGLYTISFSKPSARDLPKIGPALRALAQFIGEMNKNTLLTQEEQRELVVSQINQLGLSDAPVSMELPTMLKEQREDQLQLQQDMQRSAMAAKQNGATEVSSKSPAKKATTKESQGATAIVLYS